MRLPPLYALRAFEVAARHGSFTSAARVLCITQSAVSRHVKGLEEHLGCALFERHGPRLALTEAGEQFARELARGFATLENACAAIAGQRDQLRLKAPSTLTLRWLLPALEAFHAADGRHRVQLTSVWMDVDQVDFRSEPFDCAVLLGRGDFPADWQAVRLFDEWLVPVCAPALLGEGEWDAARLARQPLIHPSRDCRDWQRWLEHQGWSEQVPWREGKRFDTLEMGIGAAAQGYGVSVADLALVAEDLRRSTLALPVPSPLRSGDSYYLVWPAQGAKREMARRLGDFLVTRAPPLPGG